MKHRTVKAIETPSKIGQWKDDKTSDLQWPYRADGFQQALYTKET